MSLVISSMVCNGLGFIVPEKYGKTPPKIGSAALTRRRRIYQLEIRVGKPTKQKQVRSFARLEDEN